MGTDVNFGPMTLTVSYFYLQGSLSNSRQADVVMRWLAPVYSSLGYDFRTTGAFRNITHSLIAPAFSSIVSSANSSPPIST